MTAKSRIQDALKTIMDEGDANACDVYRGYDYDGSIEAMGWWYRPFNRQAVYLGKSLGEALSTIEDIESCREDAPLTVQEAAERLGRHESRVRALCREGRIPAQKFGHIWMIERTDLEKFAKIPRPRGRRPKAELDRGIIVWDGANYDQDDGYYYQIEDLPGGNAYGEPVGPFWSEDEAKQAAKESLPDYSPAGG
jgi:excisionase family DNA binding protein